MGQRMMHPIEAIAYHGWGYDHTCWDVWQSRVVAQTISFAVCDRGYFGEPAAPQFSEDGLKLLLVHSFGLHLCPVEQLQTADALIIFSSFLTFHPTEERAKRRSQRVLQRMVDGFKVNPGEVLTAFKTNSDDPVQTSPRVLNAALLLQDLENLGVSRLDPQVLQSIPTIMIFHGTGDRIVPVSQGQELARELPAHTVYIEIPEAGHALPFTHQQECWEILRARWSRLRDVG
jgi:pimeloyl-[acyl-carrier protein] methyl ester esterase